jgi:hypothetical protein
MKKKLLFIAPDYYGFHEVVFQGIVEYTDYDAVMAISDTTKGYEYKNFAERVENFFSKTFLRKNLKKIRKKKPFLQKINQYDYYDVILVNRPDILDEGIYELLEAKKGKMVVLFWDSLEKIKGQKETLNKFDVKYSFDSDDCKNYNLIKINNFYFNTPYYADNQLYDVVFLGTYDDRYSDLIKIINALKKQNINIKSYIYNSFDIDFEVDEKLAENIFKLPDSIPFIESYKIGNKGKILLDLAHKNQLGLSFRPFEAMKNKQKLITNNIAIKNYDFYNPNNIYIIENMNDIIIPKSFFNTPYQEIDEKITEKYHIKNWINNILNAI